jgi:hypothetical protein
MTADEKVTEFKALINDSSVTDIIIEDLFNLAARTYNIFGCEVPIMEGTAGSKTVNYTDEQEGAVFQGARIVYASFYKNASNTPSAGVGGINASTSDLMSNATVWGMLKDIALALKGAVDAEEIDYRKAIS